MKNIAPQGSQMEHDSNFIIREPWRAPTLPQREYVAKVTRATGLLLLLLLLLGGERGEQQRAKEGETDGTSGVT